MQRLLALLALLLPIANCMKHCNVIIIGAGGAGAHFGVFANDNGYSVCMLEKQAQIGGHCTDGPNVSLGFLLFHNTTKNNERGFGTYTVGGSGGLEAHFGRFGEIVDFGAFTGKVSFSMDAENNDGVHCNTPAPTPLMNQLITTVAGYLQLTYPELENATNADNIPSILTQPAAQFFKTEPFLKNFAGFFTATSMASGIVPFASVSAWDVLKGNVPSFLMGIVENGFMLKGKNGCRPIYDNMTEYLQTVTGNSLYLNATVNKITRPRSPTSNGKITVHFQVNGETEEHLIGDKLVLAFPPTLENLAAIGLTVQPEERAVFQHMIVSSGYYALQFASGENKPSLSNSNAEQEFGEANFDITPVPMFLCDLADENGNSGPCHGYGVTTSASTITEVSDRVEHQLDLMRLLPTPVNYTLTRVVEHKGYFPHFTQAALANDPTLYGKLNALQDKYNTLWIGAGSSYADRTLVLEHAYRIAQRYLGPTRRVLMDRNSEQLMEVQKQHPSEPLTRRSQMQTTSVFDETLRSVNNFQVSRF